MGARLIFYPVSDQMALDLSTCKSLASTNPPDVLVLVHYFGKPAPAELIAAFCKEQGAWLVEDATHVLRPVSGVGEVGDCVLYSPHKHLPISDGALLVVRSNGPARLAEQGKVICVLREISACVINSSGFSNKSATLWMVKRMLQRLGVRSHRAAVAFRTEAEQAVLVAAHPRMSVLAKRLLNRLKDRLDAVARLREQRALDWFHMLQWANPASILKPLAVTTTPYLAGFVCGQEEDAELLFDRFQRAGIPVTTWPDMPPEVMAHSGAHCFAISLRHSRLYLPVHQSLDSQQIIACGKRLLVEATMQWQVRALARDEWEGYWSRCHKANLLQSWQYGAAKEETEGWKPYRFLIANEISEPIALVQVLTRGLPKLGGVARLNRGPLLLPDIPEDAEVPIKLAVLKVLMREGHRQRWWMMQVAPELKSTNEASMGLRALDFNKLPAPSWGSGRLWLGADEQTLFMGLNGKWRNCLRKGEKLGVTVTHYECKDSVMDLLIRSYSGLQSKRGFAGLSEKMIRALARQEGVMWQFNVFVARELDMLEGTEPLGLLVTIRSGDTAIYLIGSTNDKGRQMQSNSVLLWKAILHAKRSGCAWFDIGGLSKATPKGIAEFKQGVNAKPYELIGEWRKW
jgi:dTDP-4-amino-4,6-dideoxygalactose transaminase